MDQKHSRTVSADSPAAERWRQGFGPFSHRPRTAERAAELVSRLADNDPKAADRAWSILAAADRLASAAMWLVAHMTYVRAVDPNGAPLPAEAFKPDPQGHTGGSLNMAIAYAGLLAADALSGTRRRWLMGQGHCVAAIEAVNLLTGRLSAQQVERYDLTRAGLSRFCSDFYGYALAPDGSPAAPLGSHVGPQTAGGLMEGGYLGCAEVQYAHVPMPGERLVAFLSDGAYEEQRGADWSPRWWRAQDTGLVTPVMILNGRRIEQRTEIAQEGGVSRLNADLALHDFDPMDIAGDDPAEFAWAILEAERRLQAAGAEGRYPVAMPYVVASVAKGWGFPGAGTNRAHNLPLGVNPHTDEAARRMFNDAAAALFTPPQALRAAVATLGPPASPELSPASHPSLPLPFDAAPAAGPVAPMAALDAWFVALADANPHLRIRVGNPDELASNGMPLTLARLRHRVCAPEPGVAEAVDGQVVTVLNEEAVLGAALGNKGGLNLVVTYEAFAVRMLGALRQEVIFARRQRRLGAMPQWIGLPVVATSHLWENGKNDQSHQDSTFAEALLGEMSDTARVLFPPDAPTAVRSLRSVYAERGVIAAVVAPKRPQPVVFDAEAADILVRDGAGPVVGNPEADVQLVAIGAYQLGEALAAADRLAQAGVSARVDYVLEPGRLRLARDPVEACFVQPDDFVEALFPRDLPRVMLCHTRPEPMLGVLRRIDGGRDRMRALGYINRGGTLDPFGMLFANANTWAHAADAAGALLGKARRSLLDPEEIDALDHRGRPRDLEQRRRLA
ncbi:MAG: xylulose 5-phosphate 3-epimerase [Proteobacteria bacterium]|nr:xylulose 5-phosphate 3-epimerase [Pseudomonadota bacterium]